jgi:diguanylate cyclase (GGDEF)-like protein
MSRLRLPAGLRVVDAEGRPLLELGQGWRRGRVASERDVLTGLPTADSLAVNLERELARIGRGGQPGCLAILGLDDFRRVNEEQGYAAGDRVLVEVAELVTARSRTSDVVIREGGDRFALLLPRTRLGDAYVMAQRLVAAVAERFGDATAEPTLTASVGLAPITPTTRSPDEVHGHALKALHTAKARQRGSVDVARHGVFEELRSEREQLVEAAQRDDRTGLLNSRRFASDLDDVVARSRQLGQPYGLLLADIDRFHDYNRTYGLLAGDEALRTVAQLLGKVLAPARVYRYGGEEFTALFDAPVTADEVDQAGEQAVAAVRDLAVPHVGRTDGSDRLTVTAAGCAVDPAGDPQAALRAIDSAMIRGKAAGRDRYVPLS